MNKVKEINNEVLKYQNISTKYEKFEKLIELNSIEELKKFSKEFKKKIESNLEENRKLRIGIVGQIKAGKSSFLNSLIFEGEDILPKAATPMTAALTRIVYSPEPKAEIDFYDIDEWHTIEDLAKKYEKIIDDKLSEMLKEEEEKNKLSFSNVFGNKRVITQKDAEYLVKNQIPEDIKSAKELVEMVKKGSLDINSFLGKTETIEDSKLESLNEKLKDFVGAEGKYTPIVKSSTLYINNKLIDTLEIIDTPGVNDPIISRGMKTKEFLAKCDIVFLLSYSGQFMDNSDVGYMIEKLPNEGIRNIILLGSKFDSALLDEARKYKGNIKEGLLDLRRKLEKQAENILLPLIEADKENMILQNIKKSLPPRFISSMTYAMSRSIDNLNAEQQNILKNLQNDFPTVDFNAKLLNDLSNIEHIRTKEFKNASEQKEEIMKNKVNDLIFGQKREFKRIILDIKEQAENNIQSLSGNKKEITAKYKEIEKNINDASNDIEEVFSSVVNGMKSKFSTLKIEIKNEASYYEKLNVMTGTKEESYQEKESGFFGGAKRFFGGLFGNSSSGYTTKYRTLSYNYADVYSVVENINKYVRDSEDKIKNEISNIFDVKQFKKELVNAVILKFDTSSEYFDEKDIKRPIQNVLDDILIPDIDFDSEKYSKKITSEFGTGKVTDYQVDELRRQQSQVISEIIKDIAKHVDSKGNEIIISLKTSEDNFVSNIKEKISKIQNNLQEMIENKEKYEKLGIELLENIADDLKNLKD